jgi:hypothetical protein
MHWYVPLGEIVHHYIQTNIENRTLVENLKTQQNLMHSTAPIRQKRLC